MRYKAIKRDNGEVYLQRIPESPTDDSLTIIEVVVLELSDKIEKLQNTSHNSDYTKCGNCDEMVKPVVTGMLCPSCKCDM